MELLRHELWSISVDFKMDSKSKIMNSNCVRATVITDCKNNHTGKEKKLLTGSLDIFCTPRESIMLVYISIY